MRKFLKSNSSGFLLFLKGFFMGLFDLVPGVSGGSIALITGIYKKLMKEISAFFVFLNNLFLFKKSRFQKSWSSLDVRFLLLLVFGIFSGILVSVFVLSFFLNNFFVQTMGFITGLILIASLFLIKKNVGSMKNSFFGAVGIIIGVVLSFLSPASGFEFNFFQVFLLGLITIVAMILPGISGALILLLLGGYEFMIFSLRNLLNNYFVILVFIIGAVVGLGLFSRGINYLLKKHHDSTMSFLSCLMLGAVTKPVLEIFINQGNQNVFFAIPFFVIGCVLAYYVFSN